MYSVIQFGLFLFFWLSFAKVVTFSSKYTFLLNLYKYLNLHFIVLSMLSLFLRSKKCVLENECRPSWKYTNKYQFFIQILKHKPDDNVFENSVNEAIVLFVKHDFGWSQLIKWPSIKMQSSVFANCVFYTESNTLDVIKTRCTDDQFMLKNPKKTNWWNRERKEIRLNRLVGRSGKKIGNSNKMLTMKKEKLVV